MRSSNTTLTILAHKIALDPTVGQANYFARACGVARFTWNWGLSAWNEMYASGQKPTLAIIKKRFNEIKRDEFPWIYKTHKDANQQPLNNLGAAFGRFFRKKSGHPVFKKKSASSDSCYVSNDKFTIDEYRVRLPIIGWVRTYEKLRFVGKIMGATISREADRWFLSVHVETLVARVPTDSMVVGVDLGLSALATLSTGESIEGPKPLRKALKKLRRANKSLSRKIKGSNNRKKAARALSCIHARVARVRNDFLHKLTTRLCRENQTVVIEDLNIGFMLKNRHISRAASDMGLGEFGRQMKYKAPMFGTDLIIADRFFPSTKTCSGCGELKDMPLSERTYRCGHCGLVLPRDHNAAINLEHLSTRGLWGFKACAQEGSGSPITEKRNRLDEAGTKTDAK